MMTGIKEGRHPPPRSTRRRMRGSWWCRVVRLPATPLLRGGRQKKTWKKRRRGTQQRNATPRHHTHTRPQRAERRNEFTLALLL